jgi:hypothetical protein
MNMPLPACWFLLAVLMWPADIASADPVQAYIRARHEYAAKAQAYWTAVTEKRRIRMDKRRSRTEIVAEDYVLTQPPVYSGPPKPTDHTGPIEEPQSLPRKKYVPVVAEIVKAAADHFGFVPQRPGTENDFKRAYARAAAAAGLTRDQVVRVYAFEAGGNGRYDLQAGLAHGRGRAISTALGYNQLLAPNTIGILAEKGDRIIEVLQEKSARSSGEDREKLTHKIAIMRRMIDFTRTVPVRWSEHDRLSETPQWWALHALNLDIDVGPLLQTQKLLNSVTFARRNGFARPLTAAELEIINFTGDGSGFDIVSMPEALRTRVPTANFFQQRGYERNPIASRNNVVAKLLAAIDAKMDREVRQQGAREMAAAFAR